MENKVFQEYETPQLDVVEIEVEQGFATSGGPEFTPFGPEDDWN